MLPTDVSTASCTYDFGWQSVSLELLPPSKVQAVLQQGPHGRSWVQVTTPFFAEDAAVAAAKVTNRGSAYGDQQIRLKRQLAERKRKAAAMAGQEAAGASAAAAPAEEPDSTEVRLQKWRPMRDQAMAELHTALVAMLRQAMRYRGPIPFPLTAAAPPAAAGAAAPAAQAAGAQPVGVA